MKEKLSWDEKTGKDCFGLGGNTNIDHIWPISKGGANNHLNKLLISEEANMAKGGKTKGKINNYKFAVRREVTKDGDVYGVLIIKANSSDEWVKIIGPSN